MIQRLNNALTWLWVVTLALALFVGGCSDDGGDSEVPSDPNNVVGDVGPDVDDEPDVPAPVDMGGDEMDIVEDEPDGEDGPAPGTLCAPCLNNDECGEEVDLCVNLPFEGSVCAKDCTLTDEVCPDGFQCATIQEFPELVRQCVPENLLCDDKCEGVTCGFEEVCDPLTGMCGPRQGLCDQPCISDDNCGGPDDQCLLLPGGNNERICSQDCSGEDATCPEGYFCALVSEEDDIRQCVPQDLTCIDRCSDVMCGDDEGCDPLTGFCEPLLGLCDINCVSNGLCGDGPEDICINLDDNGPNGESFCATGCDPEDNFSCPVNFFCATLQEGDENGVCVPQDLTCVTDRCDAVDCGAGFNCDVRTGECVRSELGVCDQCGDLTSPSCGGPEDLCLNLGDPGGVICSQDCSLTGECPNEGYTCVIIPNSTRRACIPSVLECRLCDGITCDEGATCNPATGECVAPPASCVEVGCAQGEICNPDIEECEIIGELCNFDTRIADCFGPVRKCSATRRGADGVCAVICDDDNDCTPEAPNCLDLYRVGELCVPDGLGGPSTCGVTAPADVSIGRPCGSGVQARCAPDAPTCIDNVEDDVEGFCSLSCGSDADCGGDGVCQPIRGRTGRFCVPANCLCLTGAEVPDGTTDLLALALNERQLTRCSFSLDPTSQRALNPATPGAPLRPALLSGVSDQPLAATGLARSLRDELDQAMSGERPVRDAIVAAAARQGASLEARDPFFDLPEELDPLSEGLRDLVRAAGGEFDGDTLNGDVNAVPVDALAALGQILAAIAEVVRVRQAIVTALELDEAGLDALYLNAPALFLPPSAGAAVPDLSDDAALAQLEGFDLAALAQASADLAAVIQGATLDGEALAGVALSAETPVGRVVIGNAGDTVYGEGESFALLVDVSGADRYENAVGATADAGQPVSVAIDLGGADQYGYVEVADDRDQEAWLPSDADGRFIPERPVQADNGPVSLSNTGRQGAGRLGVGMLFDLGAGDDSYTSLRMSQGAGILGVGVLYDDGGADNYSAEAFAQGAALLGIGVQIDDGDNGEGEREDAWRLWHAGQGFGTARGVGLLIDEAGDSRYTGEAATGLSDVLYFSPPDRGQSNQNLVQGAGAGLLPADQRFPERQATGGGLGALYDRSGDDQYRAGTFAQGAGVHLGAGLLIDDLGADVYEARYGAQGFGELVAVGVLLEGDGADAYNLEEARRISSLMGFGTNLGSGTLLDQRGDDRYSVPSLSGGVGQLNGAGLLFDLGGADTHTALSTSTWGFASLGLPQDDPDAFRREVPTYGLFIDAGAQEDTYTRLDLENNPAPLIGNNQSWIQQADDAVPGEIGIGIDGEGATGLE